MVSSSCTIILGRPAGRDFTALYVPLMTDYLLDILGVGGDIMDDGPLAQNQVYLDLLAQLRPSNGLFESSASEPTVTATLYLCHGNPVGLAYRPETSTPRILGLGDYRAAWRERLNRHTDAAA